MREVVIVERGGAADPLPTRLSNAHLRRRIGGMSFSSVRESSVRGMVGRSGAYFLRNYEFTFPNLRGAAVILMGGGE